MAAPNLVNETVPVPLTDRDRRQTAQEEAAREAQRMAEEMATERVNAIQSSIQQQLQQRDQQLQQRDEENKRQQEEIKRQQEENKRQQEENKRLAAQLQQHIAKSASAPPASANEHIQTRALSLLEVSYTGKQFTWKKTREVTLRLRGKELSWWAFSKKDEVQSCVIPSSVNIIFVPHKNKVKIRSYGTQHVFLRLFFISSETAETWRRYLEDARATPDGNASAAARATIMSST